MKKKLSNRKKVKRVLHSVKSKSVNLGCQTYSKDHK